jgi:hypothetical protein
MDTDPAGATPAKPVVTLFEQYGAGATYVGRKVAEQLGLPFHAQTFTSEDIEGGGEEARLDQNATLAMVYAAMGGAYGGFEGRDVVATQRQKYDLIADNNRAVRAMADQAA